MTDRWLVTGAAGQLGGAVLEALQRGRPSDPVLAVSRDREDLPRGLLGLDVTDEAALQDVLTRFQPTRIVHLAGTSAPREAEADTRGATRRDVGALLTLSAYLRGAGGWLLYPSSDWVVAGEGVRPFRETDKASPATGYGQVKLTAEGLALATGRAAVVRFPLLCGMPAQLTCRSTWRSLHQRLLEGQEVLAVTDEYRSAMSLHDAARLVLALAEVGFTGLVHAAGPSVVTPFDIISAIARSVGREDLLVPGTRGDLPGGHERPRMAALDSTLLRRLLPSFKPAAIDEATFCPVDLPVHRPASCPEFGVVVPVYRGAAVLSRSLLSLAAQQGVKLPVHVVVAVNDGSRSSMHAAHTAAADVRAAGMRCDVISTRRGRTAAFNAAEQLLSAGPRLYLDQDAELSGNTLSLLERQLAPGTGVHFAAPALAGPNTASRVSERYYRVWRELPYVQSSPVTVGAYALSQAGRRRWGTFPDLASDDKWTRLQFPPAHRRVVAACTYSVLLPTTLPELVQARRRYAAGNRQLALLMPDPVGGDLPRRAGVLTSWLRRPKAWPSVAVFLAVHAAAAAARQGARQPA